MSNIMKMKRLILLLLLLSLSVQAYPQKISGLNFRDTLKGKQSASKIILNDLKISLNDGGKVFTSPLRFDARDGLMTFGVLATTGLLFTVDDETRDYFKKQKSNFNDVLADVGNFYGTIYPSLIVGGGLYATGLIIKNEDIRVTGRMAFESVAIAGLITTISKSLMGRHRPYNNDGSLVFEGPTFKMDFLSLPSGHATVAFALSTTLANRIDNTFASIGLYTLAAVTSLSRIYDDMHWASDVFLGSAIGYFVADFISRKKDKNSKYTIIPTGNGIKLVYTL